MVWKLFFNSDNNLPIGLSDILKGEEAATIGIKKDGGIISVDHESCLDYESYSGPFTFLGLEEDRPYQLHLSESSGLVQIIPSSRIVNFEELDDADGLRAIAKFLGKDASRVRYTEEKCTGYNKPHDFRAVADFAHRRFTQISDELYLHPLETSLDFPEDFLDDKQFVACLLIDKSLHPEDLRDKIYGDFYRLYCNAIDKIQNTNDVEKAQLKELVRIFRKDG